MTEICHTKTFFMKKITSLLAIAAVALTAVFSFASCSKNDDNLEPADTQTIPVYTVGIGDGALELLDIKLNIYRNGKKMEVILDKNKVTPITAPNPVHKYLNGYCCSSVNGEEGVDSVVAKVSLKPNVKDIIASKDPKEVSNFYTVGRIYKVKKAADGNYLEHCDNTHSVMSTWEQTLSVGANDEIYYERLCKSAAEFLSKDYVSTL